MCTHDSCVGLTNERNLFNFIVGVSKLMNKYCIFIIFLYVKNVFG